jgi:hypothetical protein
MKRVLIILIAFFYTQSALAYHPLVTDDTGTEGQGNVLLELNNEHRIDGEFIFEPILNIGIIDSLDLVISTNITNLESATDPSLEFKWRFFEEDIFSFAIKPIISIPVQDEFDFALSFIASQQIGRVLFHENIEYGRSKELLLSAAADITITNWLKTVVDFGSEDLTNKDYFVLGGLIFPLLDNKLLLDVAVKYSRSSGTAILTGIAVGF